MKCTAIPSHFDKLVEESDVCILYFWWRRKWKMGAHFVTIHKSEKGIIGYKTYRNSKGLELYGQSLDEFLKKRKYFGAVLIGIKSK